MRNIKKKWSEECMEHSKRYEPKTGKSKTVPDQGLTVREIMKRNSRGLPAGGVKVPLYEEDLNNPFLGGIEPRTLDLAQKEMISRQTAEQIADGVKDLRERKRKYTEEKKKAEVRKEIEEEQRKLKEEADKNGSEK